MLKSITAVTYSVKDLESSRSAFERWLNYRTVESGRVDPLLAARWNSAQIAGRPFSLMQPASGEAVFLRLVETTPVPGFAPLLTYGWNAAELHVQDVFALAESLEGSPFRIIGGPRDLLDNGAVIAMQVLGPGNELLYLTQLNHEGMRQTYGRAESPVGRVFIVVLGARDQQETLEFYRPMSIRTTARKAFKINVLAQAHGMDSEVSRFDIASAVLSEPFRVEVDDYPDSATERPVPAGGLPPGLSLVSFEVERQSGTELPVGLDWREGPAGPPYLGRRFAVTTGSSGEWLELIESA